MSFTPFSQSSRFPWHAERKHSKLRRKSLPLRLEQLEDRVMLSIADMNYVEQAYRDVLQREAIRRGSRSGRPRSMPGTRNTDLIPDLPQSPAGADGTEPSPNEENGDQGLPPVLIHGIDVSDWSGLP